MIERGQTVFPNRQEMGKRFSDHLAEAATLIEQTGYHRRDEALAELEIYLQTSGFA